MNRQHAYAERQANETFALAWHDAMESAVDLLEQEAFRRATAGRVRTERKLDADGKVLEEKTVEQYSDTLLIFLLKGHRPDRFRENVRVEQTGAGGGPIRHEVTTVERAAAAARAELERLAGRGSA